MSKLETFLNSYPSKVTQRNYLVGIKKFMSYVYPESSQELGVLVDRYFSREPEQIEQDLIGFTNSMNGAPPKTVGTRITSVKMLLLENKVEMSRAFWRKINRRIRGHRAATIDKIPSKDELRQLLIDMPLNGRALFLLLACSGMRIGEALQLRLNDLDMENRTINIRGAYTKSGDSRFVFFTEECAEVLEQYLDHRDEYVKRSIDRSRYNKEDDDRVFSMCVQNAHKIWIGALDKHRMNGRDPTTERRRLHPHALRKWFRTILGPVIPVDIVEALMGHEAYLSDVYRKYSPDQLREQYDKAESTLTILREVSKAEVESLERRLTEREAVITGLVTQMKEIQESRKESDTVMDALFREEEFRKLLSKKLKELG